MLDLFDTNMQYFLIGDFNSRVGVTADFVEPDDNLFHILKNNNCQLRESIHAVDILRKLNIPLSRCSEDKGRQNSLGLKLINFCKDNGIFILNGRVDKDANCGKKTCKNASLIDYAIASPELFSYISEFENYNEVIANLINEVERLDVKKPDFQTDLDNIVDKINSVFIDSAADTFGQTRKRCSNANRVEQPWFNSACNAKRKSFHAAKKKYNCIKNEEMRLCLRQASADYKKELDKAYKDYEFRTENIIRETTSNDPNKLWKLLNDFGSHSSNNKANIHIDVLYKYFEDINKNTDYENNNVNLDFTAVSDNKEAGSSKPLQCLSGIIDALNNHKSLNITAKKCSTKLKWAVCRKSPIVGGVLAIAATSVVAVLIVRRRRKNDPFVKIDDTKPTECSNAKQGITLHAYIDSNGRKGYTRNSFRMEVIKSAYEGVEEKEQEHSSYCEIGDTYMESSGGEYDTSNNVNRRKQSAHGNLYDTTADIRDPIDPTYNTLERSPNVDNNVYVHSFPSGKSESD
ncbi:unnamed protein product [Mytilus coruscus]|uniref:Endonuclease/exonuclease/phosphatase domain-containing protein n=1 Tax=Mytilus coruscus TaxID=42192 RepID=A0A6J8EQ85_MYTCO|nr:unnamed protein product [Mytilus coruscus]